MTITVSTGNVSHSRQVHCLDPVSDIKKRISQWKQQSPAIELDDAAVADIDIPANPSEPLFCSEEALAKKKFETTVKIFFPSGYSSSARSQALNSALAKLRQSMPPSAAITYLNLSFPEITFADNDDDDDDDSSQDDRPESDLLTPDILDLWRTASKATGIYNIQHLGVSEFSAARLHALIKFADKSGCVKPAVNQINIRDCCVLPPSLVNLAKSHGVKLLTHNDNFNILPVDNVPEFVSLVGSTAAGSPAEWVWNWLIKITTVVADRGVVYGQGWMVELAEAAK